MLNTPGQDDHDGDLELDYGRLDDRVGGDGNGGDESLDDCPPLDDEREQVGYELFDWDPTDLDELDDALHEMGLPHEWESDGYELVVHGSDEAAIDALLPTIRFPDELAPEDDDGDDTDIQVLSALFESADRMQRDPTGDAVNAFLDAAERIGDHPPYGVGEPEWEQVVEIVDALIDLFHAAGPTGEIQALAGRLRQRIRPLV